MLKIAQLGQPILREVARDVPPESIAGDEFQSFLRDLTDTLLASGGVGLAAPQVFDGRRVFLARVLPVDDPDALPGVEVFINPRLTPLSPIVVAGWEGCLSFVELTVLVPRHRDLAVEYLDAQGRAMRMELTGFPARIIQHENDHLDGILTIDRAASTRDIVKTSEMEAVIAARKKALP